MEMIWAMGFFFIFVTFVFFVIAFFFPEWLGITGNKAREVMKSHQEDNSNLHTSSDSGSGSGSSSDSDSSSGSDSGD